MFAYFLRPCARFVIQHFPPKGWNFRRRVIYTYGSMSRRVLLRKIEMFAGEAEVAISFPNNLSFLFTPRGGFFRAVQSCLLLLIAFVWPPKLFQDTFTSILLLRDHISFYFLNDTVLKIFRNPSHKEKLRV